MISIAFFAGLYGYLFPGNINTMLMRLGETKKYALLAAMMVLALLAEYLYCYCSLSALSMLRTHSALIRALSIAGCALGYIFGIWILAGRKQDMRQQDAAIVKRGLLSILIHPQQIPFWIGVYSLTLPFGGIPHASSFALSDVAGCLVTYLLYAFAGSALLRKLTLSYAHIQTAAGLLYLVSATAALVKLL